MVGFRRLCTPIGREDRRSLSADTIMLKKPGAVGCKSIGNSGDGEMFECCEV